MSAIDQLGAPPSTIDAEKSLLGSILVSSKAFVEVAAMLRPDDFYHPAHAAIWEAMQSLDASSQPIDAVTVPEQMRGLGTLERLNSAGGSDYLMDLMASVVTATSAPQHARMVRSKAERRRWILGLWELVRAGYADTPDDAFFQRAEKTLLELTNNRRGATEDVKHVKHHMNEFCDELQARWNRNKTQGSSIIGVSTGFEHLDAILSGLRPGALTLLAARPAMGKSALAMNIVERVAGLGTPALVFSLEMSALELAQRMVSGHARIDGQRLAQGLVENAGQWIKINKAVEKLVEYPIYFCQRPTLTVHEIRSIARRWRLSHAAKSERAVVMVDYLQLVESTKKKFHSNREQDVSEISRGLKLLARELNQPVLALSQLNRAVDARADHRPMMSDLRESGAIEQDADVIAFVYRDEVYSKEDVKDEDRGVAEIIIAKQRSGPTGTVRMKWQGEYTRFDDLEDRQ